MKFLTLVKITKPLLWGFNDFKTTADKMVNPFKDWLLAICYNVLTLK